MKNFDNYVCDGQISLWDIFTEPKEKLCEVKADDSVCEGCKWRKYKARELEVDEHGQTWVYKCPGTACANWRHGTPMNISCKEKEIQDMYCYNRDFLPELEYLVPMVEAEFDCKFKQINRFGRTEYVMRYKQTEFSLSDSHYTSGDHREGKRFVDFSWNASREGMGRPCDNLDEVIRFINSAFNRADEIAKLKREARQQEWKTTDANTAEDI